jgi:hypothetical protein
VPADLFAVARPSNPSSDEYEELDGTGGGGSANDVETSQSFTPMWIGQVRTLGMLNYCNASNVRFRSNESEPPVVPDPTADPDLAPDPSGPITAVDANYALVSSTTACQPGVGPLDDPDLTITAYAAASTLGQTWQSAYQGLIQEYQAHPQMDRSADAGIVPVTLGGIPTTAYVVPYGSDQVAVTVASLTTVYTIKGRISRAQVPTIVSAMQPIP